jgi:hypothetical protein
MRNLQVTRVLRSQRHVQYMQQKGVQQLFAEKRTHKEQDNLPWLLCALEQFSSLLKSASNNRSR